MAIKIFKITGRRDDGSKMKAVCRPCTLTFKPSNRPTIQRFYKEAALWKRLAHKNILPCLGISMDVAELCLISPLIDNGCITECIRNNPQANPLELVCMIFVGRMDLKDTVNGLNYLHTCGRIHSDLRATCPIYPHDSTSSSGVARRNASLWETMARLV